MITHNIVATEVNLTPGEYQLIADRRILASRGIRTPRLNFVKPNLFRVTHVIALRRGPLTVRVNPQRNPGNFAINLRFSLAVDPSTLTVTADGVRKLHVGRPRVTSDNRFRSSFNLATMDDDDHWSTFPQPLVDHLVAKCRQVKFTGANLDEPVSNALSRVFAQVVSITVGPDVLTYACLAADGRSTSWSTMTANPQTIPPSTTWLTATWEARDLRELIRRATLS